MLSMKGLDKLFYEAPATLVFEAKTEGVICTSPGDAGLQNYNWNNPVEE